jgi:hypothetical protein
MSYTTQLSCDECDAVENLDPEPYIQEDKEDDLPF